MNDSDSSDENFSADAVRETMAALLSLLPSGPSAFDSMSNRQRVRLRNSAGHLLDKLQTFHLNLDPIEHPSFVFDPSNPRTVGELIAKTLLIQPRLPLSEVASNKFHGSGVYAIYYTGDFEAYQPASRTETPLYIGKVDPRSHDADSVESQGTKLFDRLKGDHAKSIRLAENLELDDFQCRYLVVKSAWQNTAESYLIHRLKPIWNNEINICFGIGKHGDSSKTRRNTRSPWDTLHPGRAWAWNEGNTPNPKTQEDIISEIKQHYIDNPPTTDHF